MSDRSESPSFSSQWPGMLIMFVTVIGSMSLAHSFEQPVIKWLSLEANSPGDAPPWYFITRDFAQGICSLGALILCLIAAALTLKKWPVYGAMMIWMPMIWLGPNIAQSWIIYLYCPGLLQGQRSTARWPDFNSYLDDPLIESANTTILVGTLVLVFALPALIHLLRNLRKKQTG